MSIPSRVWTIIQCGWSGFWFAGLFSSEPLADKVLNHPVAEKEAEDTG